MSLAEQRAMVEDYCLMCHSDAALTGGLTLESFGASELPRDTEVAEKMLRKLRTGMMPPSYASRPDRAEVAAFNAALESRIDAAYLSSPNPGRRDFQRLNRAEYRSSVSYLLALDVDVAALLPPDTVSHSFDNIADVQGMSPTLMDSYMRAADQVSRLAVGDPTADPSEVTFKVPRTASQTRRVEGAPFGTRGGISVVNIFPADGDYIFKALLHGSAEGELFGRPAGNEQIEVSVNGARVALLDVDPMLSETEPNGLTIQSEPIYVKAGPQRVTAAFLVHSEAPVQDLLIPIEHTLADAEIGVDYGVTTVPHLRDFNISGPYNVTGVSDTPARRRIFICRPTTSEEELPCAEEIVTNLASFLRGYSHLIIDRDSKYTTEFREVLKENNVDVVPIPTKSPNCNPHAERFVRSIKEECLNRMVLFGRNALERALREYRIHYLRERNHQGLGNRLLDDFPQDADGPSVECRKRLGGLLRYYYRAAA